jgi:hypothetical protein
MGKCEQRGVWSMKKFSELSSWGAAIAIIIIIAVAILFPFLFIWALNTLFNLSIGYTLETWSAAVLLQMFFQTKISTKGK